MSPVAQTENKTVGRMPDLSLIVSVYNLPKIQIDKKRLPIDQKEQIILI